MITLGIKAPFHACSAELVRDGVVIAAAGYETFTRVKQGKRLQPPTTWQLPLHAIDYCLKAGITLSAVDRIAHLFDATLLADDTAQTQRLKGDIATCNAIRRVIASWLVEKH